MIIALTPNPALDRTVITPGFRHSDVTRVQGKHDSAGGKGLNVARALHRLGAAYHAVAPLGGATGAAVAVAAQTEGLSLSVVPVAGETRTCLSLTDPDAPDQLVVNEPGPTVTATEWALLADTVRNLCTSADWLTISGSLPTGVGPTDLQALVTSIAPRSRVALDTSGAPLRGMLTAPIALLKINRSELADATGLPLTDHGAIVAAARTLCAAGPQAVVITLGAAGALAVDSRGAWHISAPHIVARSPVGSGDCMLAGLVAALVDGAPLAEAVAAGVAAGSANALVPYAGVFDPAVAAAFRRDATITRLG